MQDKIVLKIGGSSLTSIEDYALMAKKVAREAGRTTRPVVVVISAQKGETDRLWKEAEELYTNKWWQVEHVALEGEFVSAHTLLNELLKLELEAKLVSPWDIDLAVTGEDPENCSLAGADTGKFNRNISHSTEDVIVVPGYVGVHANKESSKGTPMLAALGRNSTDLIAVEVAKCYNASLYFVKSAPTIYTVSPALVDNPEEINHMTYEQALRFLEYLPQDDQFIMRRAVELAWKNKVELVFGSLNGQDETRISASPNGESGSGFRAMPVKENVSMVSFEIPAHNRIRAGLFKELHLRGVQFSDKIEVRTGRKQRFTLFVDESMKREAADIARVFSTTPETVETHGVALITLIDTKLDPESHHSSMESKAFEKEDINIFATTTSGIIMHMYVGRNDIQKAVRILADKFVL